MSLDIKNSDEVWTRDDHKLGEAHRLYHRQSGADSDLALYASYLYIVSYEMGDDFYVPTNYIEGRDENGRLRLAENMSEIQNHTWTRLPDFVARGNAKIEELPN